MKLELQLCTLINDILNTNYTENELKEVELQRLGFDSLLFIRLLLQIEDVFEIKVEDKDLTKPILKSYNGLLEYIKTKKCE